MSVRRFKIALVCSTLNQIGGPAAHMRNFYKHLNGSEFHLMLIFCSQNEKTLRDFMSESNVDAKDVIFIPHVEKRMLLPFIFTLRDIFRRDKFDIVHAFDTQTQVLAGWAASLAGVKKFICHSEAQFLPSTISFPKRVLFRILNFLLRDYFTKTVVISNGLKKELIKNRFRSSEKIRLIHLGIETTQEEIFDFSYDGLEVGAPVIGAVSRLSVEKGLDRFIRAMPYILKDIPAARFVIYGDGKEQSSLRSLAQSLGVLARVEFKPWVKDVLQALRGLEVFVMPSHREGLPITLLEAMSVGRLCVASDIEGIRDVINTGVDGVLVDTANAKSFSEAIISVCRDYEKAAAMGKAAAQKVRTDFNIEREAFEIKELYEEILSC